MPLKENLSDVMKRMERAALSVGRNPSDVHLVAVSKTVSVETLAEAYGLGLRTFGENRFQEALPKLELLPKDIDWHFIGRLQSNKARKVAELFGCIQAIDSEGQLKEIAKASKAVDVFIEVNIANEPQKSGIPTERVDEFWQMVTECKGVRVQGLMTIGPNLGDPEAMRPYFRELRRINERLGGRWLSMGMSSDFDVAIQEGATHVRVGSALFGDRRE